MRGKIQINDFVRLIIQNSNRNNSNSNSNNNNNYSSNFSPLSSSKCASVMKVRQ
ncbi:unnamed protein product, partial [Ceratitis capitata]